MELSAIYHRPESEYAYLYKDKKLHIRIRTKKGDIESINLHYRDPFIFMEEFYQDTKEMVKITSGTLFDHWQVEVSVDFARIQYLFELRDTEGQNILYGDKGCVENSLEIFMQLGMDLSCLIFMRLMPARFLTGFQIRYGIRYFLKDLPMAMLY